MQVFFWVVALTLGGGETVWTLDEVRARARANPVEARLDTELAALERDLEARGRRFSEGPTVALSLGPRRAEGDVEPDAELEVDWPLAARPAARRALASALEGVEPVLRSAARIEARRRIEQAFVAAWEAQERVTLQAEDLAIVERWEAHTQRRVEAGAQAPFEADLVRLELSSASSALAQARVQWVRARAALGLLADVPADLSADFSRLERPSPPSWPPGDDAGARLSRSALTRAAAARAELEASRADFELAGAQSRWALRTGVAREGEESVARVGLGYRLPLAREIESGNAARTAFLAATRLDAELASSELRARLEEALAVVSQPVDSPPLNDRAILTALEARLVEGKSPAAEMLVLRRGVLAARELALERHAATLNALFELAALTAEVEP